jgi:hypothetical protein
MSPSSTTNTLFSRVGLTWTIKWRGHRGHVHVVPTLFLKLYPGLWEHQTAEQNSFSIFWKRSEAAYNYLSTFRNYKTREHHLLLPLERGKSKYFTESCRVSNCCAVEAAITMNSVSLHKCNLLLPSYCSCFIADREPPSNNGKLSFITTVNVTQKDIFQILSSRRLVHLRLQEAKNPFCHWYSLWVNVRHLSLLYPSNAVWTLSCWFRIYSKFH